MASPLSPLPAVLADTVLPDPTEIPTGIFEPAEELPEGIARACGSLEPGPVCSAVYDATENELIASIAGQVVPNLLRILLILAVAWLANRLVKRGVKRFVRQMNQRGVGRLGTLRERAPLKNTAPIDLKRVTMRTETISGVLSSVATFTIWTIAVVMVLGVFRINLGPLIAGAGIIGVALGFGAQNLVRDFLSGIFMLLEDQYGVGDIVDVGEATGTVESVSLRSTRIRDISGTLWHVPNGQIMRVGNSSQLWSRALLDIGVAYDTDVDEASAVMKRVADEMLMDEAWSDAFVDAAEIWGVQELAADQVTVRMVTKVKPARQWAVERELRARIKKAFLEAGIEIPFPQRTIWVRDERAHQEFPEETGPPS